MKQLIFYSWALGICDTKFPILLSYAVAKLSPKPLNLFPTGFYSSLCCEDLSRPLEIHSGEGEKEKKSWVDVSRAKYAGHLFLAIVSSVSAVSSTFWRAISIQRVIYLSKLCIAMVSTLSLSLQQTIKPLDGLYLTAARLSTISVYVFRVGGPSLNPLYFE